MGIYRSCRGLARSFLKAGEKEGILSFRQDSRIHSS
nr:MAG TPA: hypothetical protein [Caudoviricetes sp.]